MVWKVQNFNILRISHLRQRQFRGGGSSDTPVTETALYGLLEDISCALMLYEYNVSPMELRFSRSWSVSNLPCLPAELEVSVSSCFSNIKSMFIPASAMTITLWCSFSCKFVGRAIPNCFHLTITSWCVLSSDIVNTFYLANISYTRTRYITVNGVAVIVASVR